MTTADTTIKAFEIEENATDNTPVYAGFTQQQLQDAWDKIRDKEDWKNQVTAPVAIADLSVTVAAVEFFTATRCVISARPSVMGDSYDASNDPEGCYYLWAAGYRNGPAGDH